MLEKLEELEGKVLALVKAVQERTEEIARLQRVNEELSSQMDTAEDRLTRLEEERISLLERISGIDAREEEIRSRLKGIIERISRFEADVTSANQRAAE